MLNTNIYFQLFNSTIKMQTQEILEYQNEVDKYLLSKKYKIKETLKEIDFSDKESEEYNMMLEDSLSEEYRKFEQFYQNNLRFSTILFSYSYLEYSRFADFIKR